jgi:hypothetical protein
MAGEEHWEFAIVVPAGTLAIAPLITPTILPVRKISRIAWSVPPGSAGLTGLRIGMGKNQVIPVNLGAWIVKDGESAGSDLARLPDSGAWSVIAYNTGAHPHTLYVTFYALPIRPAPVVIVPLGLTALQPGIESPPAHHPAHLSSP